MNGKDKDKAGLDKGADPKAKRPAFAVRFRNYFLAGIIVTAPIAITFWLAWKILSLIDNRVTPLIPPKWNPETYLPFGVPGLGLVVIILFLILVGFLTAGYVGRFWTALSERLVARVPVIRSVYSWVKQVFETVLSQQSTAFREVVLVEYPCRGSWAVGFITGQTEGEVQDLTSETVMNVFVPATPNPTTGFLLFIPERDVHHLPMSVEEGIKLVISGGIVTPPEKDEEEEDQRAWQGVTATEKSQRRAQRLQDKIVIKADPRKDARDAQIRFVARIRNYLFTGTLVTAPISITIWLAWEFISLVDRNVTPLIPVRWNPETYLPFGLPGLGMVIAVLLLTLIGFFTAGILGRSLVKAGERLLDRLPVIRGVYSAVKQIIETVFKNQSQAFREVVLIQYPRQESWAIGFITGTATDQIQKRTPAQSLNIFLPTTPNPTSGFLLFIPETEVRRLSMTVEEGLKMVISGGIVTPESAAQSEADTESEEGRAPQGATADPGSSGSYPTGAQKEAT
ncbi:MAG: DUF502 domain-containing protein [Pseudomonadota bacterium]